MYNKPIINTYIDSSNGYIYFCDVTHPLSTTNGKVALHRHIASVKVGRWLSTGEHVHHIDENKQNNDPSNLEILSKSEHYKLHHELVGHNLTIDVYCKCCGNLFKQLESTQQYCSLSCKYFNQIKSNITKEELTELLPKHTWTSLGKLTGYSDNGIKKRAKALGVDIRLINVNKLR